jgi:ribulose-5-phosphate 4-epimerase/fuculose-1-phosphate aldolase
VSTKRGEPYVLRDADWSAPAPALLHAPGDTSLEQLAEDTARESAAILLANHGPVVAGLTLTAAMDAIEELEETAKLFLLLAGHSTRPLTVEQVRMLHP